MFQTSSIGQRSKEIRYNNILKREKTKEVIHNLFSIQNLVIYTIGFLISMVGFSSESLMLSISPFAISFIAAMLSNYIPIGVVYIITLVGTYLKFGSNSLLIYFATTLVLFSTVLIKRPKEQLIVNEGKKLGIYTFLSVLLVQIVPMFFRDFYVYDLLTSIMLAISSYVFYKIFTNALPLLKDFGNKTVFSVEEVMGTSLLLAITVCSFGKLTIYGFNLKNILSILIVLVLGWKNGMLVGATSGIMIGVVLGIIGGSEPILVASYAISGMVAGLFNRLGKTGVVIGFILGNIALTYVENGNTVPVILIQEILIASLGLLAIPKKIRIDIKELYGKDQLLPEQGITSRILPEYDETISKLNNMSDLLSDIAQNYDEAATTVVNEKDIIENSLTNEQIFKQELKTNLLDIKENLLYKEIYEDQNNITDDIFKFLEKNDMMNEKAFVTILENHNNYLVGFYDQNSKTFKEVSEMVKVINSAYRVSKLNFVWKKKINAENKSVSTQLQGVSKVISDLANEMQIENIEEKFKTQKQEIVEILRQKNIKIEQIKIRQELSKKYFVEIITKACDEIEGTKCNIKKISKVLTDVLGDKFVIQSQSCGLRINKDICKFTYMSEDKYKLQVGIATCKKEGSIVSGDSNLEIRLEDGKYLLAISDGMGSGPEAMKNSKIAIKMLERLFKVGFDRETSLKLINSTIAATSKDDMYTTLDIQILDLFKGNLEFVKNGACPTYIKRRNEVQLLKSISLPVGIILENELTIYDYDLEDGDIIVICSDGVIESNKEYINKELWVKYFLEDVRSKDANQIANMILNEAIDNDFGKQKDDMTVIVSVINRK